MGLPNAWDTLTLEDLPAGSLRTIAKRHGVRVAADVWRQLKGTRFELPTRFPRTYMLRYIRLYWDGKNSNEIARALDCSVRTIERLINATPSRTSSVVRTPALEQLSLIVD